MSSSSASTPTQPDAVALVLEINQLLLQHTLSLDQHQSANGKDDPSSARAECLMRLNANLSFLAACADSKHRTKPRLTLLTPPKHVSGTDELYAKLAMILQRQSPKQALPSPNGYQDVSIASPYNGAKMTQVRASHSPKNGLMSPPSMLPAQMLQQQMQQAQMQQQVPVQQQQQLQHRQQQQQQQQRQVQHYMPQNHQGQAQSPVSNLQQQNMHHQSMQHAARLQQQAQQQRASSHSPANVNTGQAYVQQPSNLQGAMQYGNPYRQEQMRQLQMNKMGSYPQQVPPVSSAQQFPRANQHMYAPNPNQQQIAMARVAQQQSVPHQMQYVSQQFQQNPQAQMAYYPNNGQYN